MSDRSVRTAIAGGWLIRRHRGVYAVGHVPRSRESRWAAAVLAFGPGAVLSHRAAAALWALVRIAVPTEVIVPHRDGVHRRDGILVHRIPLPPEHMTMRDGIPVTSLLRVLLDLATVYRIPRLTGAFEQAQVMHKLKPELIAAEGISRRGFRGNGRLGQILDGAVDPAKVRSILELRFLRLCLAYDIARPLVNEKIGIWTPDFLWPEAKVVVETDGEQFHRTTTARRRDAQKDAFLTERGYDVVRLTWADVTERPAPTAARVAAALGVAR
jgi:hypothetical protein